MHGQTIDLTYCTNVHALADLASWRRTLGFFGPEVRRHLGWKTMPMGLWWQASLADSLISEAAGFGERSGEGIGERLDKRVGEEGRELGSEVAEYLRDLGVRAFTCNAFPYGYFQQEVVKAEVYVPDWADMRRLAYTKTCARLMAGLTPAGGFASISTLPLGWRVGFSAAGSGAGASSEGRWQAATENLLLWVEFARDLEEKTGKQVALGLEPEPGCALERTPQVLAFWKDRLLPAARRRSLDETTLLRYLGICYDTCHQAVQFEEAEASLAALSGAGIAVHKMQLSSAIEFLPDGEKCSRSVREAFAEPRFLHQTRVKPQGGVGVVDEGGAGAEGSMPPLRDYDDLPDALAHAPWDKTWRTHYHLPLQAESVVNAEFVRTTRADMLAAYHYALKHDLCRHFEVETYTWSVLPQAERPQNDAALSEAMAREIAFVVANTPANVIVRDAVAAGGK